MVRALLGAIGDDEEMKKKVWCKTHINMHTREGRMRSKGRKENAYL